MLHFQQKWMAWQLTDFMLLSIEIETFFLQNLNIF